MKPKDRAVLLGSLLGAAVQVGDRTLVARAMRAHPMPEDGVERAGVVGVRSRFYLRPVAGAAFAFVTNRVRPRPTEGWANRAVSTGLVAAGFALRAWSLRSLGEHYSPVVEIRPQHRLVTSGPYRLVRHPGYLAGLLQSAGIGLAFDRLLGVAAVAGAWLTVFVPRIREEEAALTEALGDEYRAFCAHRARLVPGVW